MRTLRPVALTLAMALSLVGCASPLTPTTTQALREALVRSHTAYLEAVAAGPVVELSRPDSDVTADLSDERRDELDRLSGAGAYREAAMRPGVDLMQAAETPTVELSLQDAIHQAVQHNLDLQVARMVPAINDTRVTQAEAAFDATFFTNAEYSILDTPRPSVASGGAPPSLGGSLAQEQFSLTTGIRKRLTSGAVVTLQTQAQRLEDNPSLFASSGGFSYYNANVSASVVQPLLRNFGGDVNRVEIQLSRNVKSDSVEDLRQSLLDVAFAAEQAYWNLYFARLNLLIQERLMERGTVERDRIKERQGFDASPVELTQANSTLSQRRSNVIIARQQVRQASDALKRILNSDDLPLTGETLIVPADAPVDAPLSYSLLDAVTTALRQRPNMQQALLAIDSATLRQKFADNQRLPELNLAMTVRFNGLGSDAFDAYENLVDIDFIDYILQANFEVPIGNRAPEALFQQRQLERQAAVLDYQRTAQDVVLEVKNALRQLITAYELIGTTRASRLAAADNLRAIEEQEKAGGALTPEFLDFKLRRQEALASAEVSEVQAISQYNVAVADYFRVLGTLLQRNQIEFKS